MLFYIAMNYLFPCFCYVLLLRAVAASSLCEHEIVDVVLGSRGWPRERERESCGKKNCNKKKKKRFNLEFRLNFTRHIVWQVCLQ